MHAANTKKKLTRATNKPTGVRSLTTGSCPAFLRLHIVEDAIAPCPRHSRHKRRSVWGCGLEGLPTDVRPPVHWRNKFEADSGGDGVMLNKDVVQRLKSLLSMRPVDIPTQSLWFCIS